eukprot:CAMPEP_0203687528 /NCGR_PEP_ID=MMETSP0091-20130426/559_1 /ASSEMBLY_ACC=CAM_ASM_001089 /TAXON_ID=426623 /ORGANISM="Chaetoceros affinis, Strain CCMP159" /LENGTH=396 /DNA_ID=CAMNT_0050556905 /DNA_START=31 /DNA_END=1221 /DNA_ORIENTATION=-
MAVKSLYKKRKPQKVGLYCTVIVTVLVFSIAFAGLFSSKKGINTSLSQEQLNELVSSSSSGSVVVGSHPLLKNDFLDIIYSKNGGIYAAENVWYDIMMKGKEIMKENPNGDHLRAFEVGAHSSDQTLIAARAGFHAYCVEPSPKSFDRIYKQVLDAVTKDQSLASYVHLFQVAAGSTSEGEVDFRTMGGTGDHVGEFDMWNMKAGNPPKEFGEKKIGQVVKVPSKRLDDIMYNKLKPNELSGLEAGSNPPAIDTVFALKVDTQGFEPHVFDGLTEAIKHRKIQYIMTEYWPNGMGLLTGRDKCGAAVGILTQLLDAGYTLYALPLAVHPKGKTMMSSQAMRDWKSRPLHDLKADCEYILELEKRFPVEDYHMGFWTDFLAVAPGSDPIVPTTFGTI